MFLEPVPYLKTFDTLDAKLYLKITKITYPNNSRNVSREAYTFSSEIKLLTIFIFLLKKKFNFKLVQMKFYLSFHQIMIGKFLF